MKKNIYKKFLEDRGWRLTKQRTAILEKIVSCKGHFDPESLYLEIKKKGVRASRASVYRTLNLFCKCGFVEKVSKTEHGTIYEHSLGRQHHDHMVCMVCGKNIEFYSERLEKLQEEICRERKFTGTNHTLEIRGYCRHCQMRRKVSKGDSLHG